jgi:glycosyltransferase involved in cell wall biosynthesis
MSNIAIDLTLLLPAGENGGAKLMTIELIQRFYKLAPEHNFILLTSQACHQELAFLEAKNLKRVCINKEKNPSVDTYFTRITRQIKNKILSKLPRWLFLCCMPRNSIFSDDFLENLAIDLLFCPFTTMPSIFLSPSIPTVAVIYDLQHKSYPMFFSPGELALRDKSLSVMHEKKFDVICISDYVRNTSLKTTAIQGEKITTVHIQLSQRVKNNFSSEQVSALLNRLNLIEDCFIFYPANFWPHKNHAMLLTAYGIYKSKYPQSTLKLVCVGAMEKKQLELEKNAQQMELNNSVVFCSYLSDHDFSILLNTCYALIFPSLYEGFGMPLVEAMACGKPILCSNVTSLPEIGGDAALYFNPNKPIEIAQAIDTIENNKILRKDLIEKGYKQITFFNNSEKMALEYLHVLNKVLNQSLNLQRD